MDSLGEWQLSLSLKRKAWNTWDRNLWPVFYQIYRKGALDKWNIIFPPPPFLLNKNSDSFTKRGIGIGIDCMPNFRS